MYFGEITAKEETPHADQEEYQQELGLDCRRIGFIAAWLEPGRLRPVGRSYRNAIHPAANWYDPDVLGIDQGISVLMAENLRSSLVWNTFMRNPECANAMQLAGFHRQG